MMSYSTFIYAIENFDAAERWLSRGRNKKDRPLYYSGLRLRAGSNADELLIFHAWYNIVIAKLHRDGTTTIQAPTAVGWRGTAFKSLNVYNVRRLLTCISSFERIYQKNWKHYIVEHDAPRSPIKLKLCRNCKGSGKQDGYCYDGTANELCEHGMDNYHRTIKSHNCWYCGGVGQRDYGSRPMKMEWDGSPIRIQNGKLVRRKPTLLEMSIANHVVTTS